MSGAIPAFNAMSFAVEFSRENAFLTVKPNFWCWHTQRLMYVFLGINCIKEAQPKRKEKKLVLTLKEDYNHIGYV